MTNTPFHPKSYPFSAKICSNTSGWMCLWCTARPFQFAPLLFKFPLSRWSVSWLTRVAFTSKPEMAHHRLPTVFHAKLISFYLCQELSADKIINVVRLTKIWSGDLVFFIYARSSALHPRQSPGQCYDTRVASGLATLLFAVWKMQNKNKWTLLILWVDGPVK